MAIRFPQSVPLKRLSKPGEAFLLKPPEGSESAGFVVWTVSRPSDHSQPHPGAIGGFLSGYTNVCTHMGCLLASGNTQEPLRGLRYEQPRGNSPESVVLGPCPCHGTTFDLARQGLVILGPATQNLPLLRILIEQGADARVVAEGWADPHLPDPRTEKWGEDIAS